MVIGKVRPVSEDRTRQIQQADAFEPLDETKPDTLARQGFVDRIFGGMNVDANAKLLGEIDTRNKRFFLQGKAGMPANQAGEPAVVAIGAVPDVAIVFF